MSSVSAPVRAQGLRCCRGTRTIVSGVELDVPAGTRLAVVGPNGAGKSTLLRTLAGLDAPSAGAVEVAGRELGRMSARRRALTVAFVGQEERPSGELTVAEAVGLGRTPYRQPWSVAAAQDRGIIDAALASVGLGGWGSRACTQLSGGERHRVVLARALAQQTPVLVLDEPTNHLDAAWRLRFMQVLDELHCTVIAAMHDLDLVLRHFDAVAVVAEGGLLMHGPPAEVLNPELLRRVFEVAGDIVPHPDTGLPYLLLTHVDPASTD
ncbi:ABC transporter ATP-binding protein [[Mycobacterium] wendilense]|uniref:ABC transporter ATP-binding protein n=1 Tax=[Mycobacterium] wendilense TaxID=3064284 RepID=A0ABM9MKC4_9MYCO|nr:ABC transporter ATP-binding protein [Mycolicibacterium sp. MU0050]CAJ1587402.1 ABC transporter ATP-binding protein [Mycolicibacterium sp. MU0050]